MSNEYITGSVLSVLRYPVKSMMGEELTVADVTEGGLVGDRAYALIAVCSGAQVRELDKIPAVQWQL